MGELKQPDPFEYFEYSEFLKDYFDYRKRLDATFTHRQFMSDAGIAGTAYLNRIIHGSRKLSEKYMTNVIKALGLTSRKEEYFRILVWYCNEKSLDKKNLYLKELLKLRATRSEYRLKDSKLKFFQKWYYPVIREIVSLVDFGKDYKLLSRMVIPPISPIQARGAVQYLLKNGFIVKQKGGGYSLTDQFVSTGPRVDSTVLVQYHKKNLQVNLDMLEKLAMQERGFSSLTLSVSREGYEQIRKEIKTFRKRLMDVVADDNCPDRVCHVGFQLLPRAKVKKRKSR
jgi:uncharacterized protein (TIGR02147 family)